MNEPNSMLFLLVANAPLLLVVIPLMGSGLVRLVGQWMPEAAPAVARTNAGLSTAIAVWLAAGFRSAPALVPGDWKQATLFPWLRWEALSIHFAVGVDRWAVPVLLLIAVTSWMAIATEADQDERAARRLSGLLLLEALLVLNVVALDGVLLAGSLLLTTLVATLGFAADGQPQRRAEAIRFLVTQGTSSLVLGVALVGMCVLHGWMSLKSEAPIRFTFLLPTVVERLPDLAFSTQAAHDVWQTRSYALGVMLLLGLILRWPLPPIHHWWSGVAEQSCRSFRAMLVVGWLPTSWLLFERLFRPVFADVITELAPRMTGWGCVAALFVAVTAIGVRANGSQRLLAVLQLSAASLAFALLWSSNAALSEGSFWIVFGISAAVALGFTVHEKTPRSLRWLVVSGVAALPGTPLFRGYWTGWEQSVQTGQGWSMWWLLAPLITSWQATRLFVDEASSAKEARSTETTEAAKEEATSHGWLPQVVLAGLLLLGGFAPQLLLPDEVVGEQISEDHE